MSKLKECKVCFKEIALGAKSCPNCGAKNKKPLYKRPWFIVIAAFIIFGAFAGGDDSTSTNSSTTSTYSETTQSIEQDFVIENEVDEDVPTEYKSALKKAESYSKLMNMSKEGLYNQLTSEYADKFSQEAAQYAIDNIKVDWKENALKKAQSYQETMSMSPSAIYDQLVSEYGEQFTQEEAQYAIDNLE